MKLKGFDKLLRKMDRLPRKGARTANRKATGAGTKVLLAGVKAEVPVQEGLLKKMQASKVTSRGTRASGTVGADVAKLKAADAQGKRPTNIDWLVEFGHDTAEGDFVPPSGYMRRGSSAAMPAAEAAYEAKMKQEIEKEAMK